MGRSCGWGILQMIDASTDEVVYMRKKKHAWEKEMYIIQHLGTKEKTTISAHDKEKSVSFKENYFSKE